MDHNLEDSLNLESDIGMDFETAEDVVVSQKDITLASSNQEGDMAMEFEHIEEQPILMDAGNEEIIISDFMGDQFHLQEYSIHDDQTTGMTTTEDSNQQSLLANQSESIDLQFNTQGITPVRLGVTGKPKYIAVKAATPSIAPKKFDISNQPIAPRQIAIAPKLPKLVPAVGGVRGLTVPQPKQVTIAPKPVSLVMNKKSFVKKVPISTVVKDPSQAGTVLAQIGKQLVMVPTSIGGQKIKLVTTGSSGMSTVQYINADSDQAQLIPTQNITGIYDRTAKPVMAKVIVQGQSTDASNQPAVITKLVGAPAAAARYVMQRKTVRVSLSGGKDVVMASPTKQGITYMKKQQVKPFKSPPPPQVVTAQAAGTAAKLIMATSAATSTQNVILKTTAPTKMITKDGKVVMQNQRSQLHQINVPGKGIQYIRLITNQNPVAAKGAQPAGTANFVLSDNKTGHLVQVSGAKAGAPPPLLYTTAGAATNKRPQKLVRLAAAPLTVKATLVSQASRSSQSLLAPLSSTETQPQPQPVDSATESLHAIQPDPSQALQLETLEEYEVAESTAEAEEEPVADSLELEETDSKAALHALINATHDSTAAHAQNAEDSENSNSMEHFVPIERSEHPLIVISSNFMKQEAVLGDEQSRQQQDDSNQMNRSMNIETDILNTYQPSTTPPPMTDGDVISDELGFKPRRACNCTKSRCLKLYCDCFANGEFCNSCNCNNCHNNLDNEELRQKAIRACLERNPNAFRPKIGKTKAGGPEIIRRHNKGCNCKRSGCLKNYCECYEAKIACTAMCKCVGCRNVEDGLQSRRAPPALYRPPAHQQLKQPCSFMTTEVIEAVCQCLIAASTDSGERADTDTDVDPVRDVIEEFSRCLQDVISASHHAAPLLDEA